MVQACWSAVVLPTCFHHDTRFITVTHTPSVMVQTCWSTAVTHTHLSWYRHVGLQLSHTHPPSVMIQTCWSTAVTHTPLLSWYRHVGLQPSHTHPPSVMIQTCWSTADTHTPSVMIQTCWSTAVTHTPPFCHDTDMLVYSCHTHTPFCHDTDMLVYSCHTHTPLLSWYRHVGLQLSHTHTPSVMIQTCWSTVVTHTPPFCHDTDMLVYSWHTHTHLLSWYRHVGLQLSHTHTPLLSWYRHVGLQLSHTHNHFCHDTDMLVYSCHKHTPSVMIQTCWSTAVSHTHITSVMTQTCWSTAVSHTHITSVMIQTCWPTAVTHTHTHTHISLLSWYRHAGLQLSHTHISLLSWYGHAGLQLSHTHTRTYHFCHDMDMLAPSCHTPTPLLTRHMHAGLQSPPPLSPPHPWHDPDIRIYMCHTHTLHNFRYAGLHLLHKQPTWQSCHRLQAKYLSSKAKLVCSVAESSVHMLTTNVWAVGLELKLFSISQSQDFIVTDQSASILCFLLMSKDWCMSIDNHVTPICHTSVWREAYMHGHTIPH